MTDHPALTELQAIERAREKLHIAHAMMIEAHAAFLACGWAEWAQHFHPQIGPVWVWIQPAGLLDYLADQVRADPLPGEVCADAD
jgi:hypothetical protein